MVYLIQKEKFLHKGVHNYGKQIQIWDFTGTRGSGTARHRYGRTRGSDIREHELCIPQLAARRGSFRTARRWQYLRQTYQPHTERFRGTHRGSWGRRGGTGYLVGSGGYNLRNWGSGKRGRKYRCIKNDLRRYI